MSMNTYVAVTFLAASLFLVLVGVAVIKEIVEFVRISRNDEIEDLRSENVELREENERLKEKIVAHVHVPFNEFAVERKSKCANASEENKTQFCYGETQDDESP